MSTRTAPSKLDIINPVRLPLPQQFTVVITEEDRQTADHFCHSGSCLLATATARTLRQFGIPVSRISEGVVDLRIRAGDECCTYGHEFFSAETAHAISPMKRPFYAPEVVGTTVTMRQQH